MVAGIVAREMTSWFCSGEQHHDLLETVAKQHFHLSNRSHQTGSPLRESRQIISARAHVCVCVSVSVNLSLENMLLKALKCILFCYFVQFYFIIHSQIKVLHIKIPLFLLIMRSQILQFHFFYFHILKYFKLKF